MKGYSLQEQLMLNILSVKKICIEIKLILYIPQSKYLKKQTIKYRHIFVPYNLKPYVWC